MAGNGSDSLDPKDFGDFPKNLLEFTDQFATDDDCREYLIRLRWPAGFVCPWCGGTRAWQTIRGQFFCASCKVQTSATAGTVLHRSRVPLRGWFLAMWLACTQKTGLSAAGLQRALGLGSYRTAWLLLQKLRAAMVRLGRERLSGLVEVDEAYVGGQEAGVRGRQLVSKCLVLVAVELDGDRMQRIRLRHVANASGGCLGQFVNDCVEPGSTVHTDGWRGYGDLQQAGYEHHVTPTRGDDEITAAEFPHVHLVVSLLKRWLIGTHQGAVGAKHLQLYLDEFTFRFNRRKSRHVGNIFFRLAEELVVKEAITYQGLKSRTGPSS